jgi:putative membrane protein insertion efficiency factor
MNSVKTEATLSARTLLLLLRSYQGLRAGRPSPCHFVPSCPAYAIEAIEVHGSLQGTWLAVKRVARCRPFGSRGFDPVPG